MNQKTATTIRMIHPTEMLLDTAILDGIELSRMKLKARNDAFTCSHCSRTVEPIEHGGYRDHCPYCLCGLHVDDQLPGDRLSTCHGILFPYSITQKKKKGFVIHYRCDKCTAERVNKAAEDDNYDLLIGLSVARQ